MRYLFSIISVLFLAGCECWLEYPLYVKDNTTGAPIVNAHVVCSRDCNEYTDSTGFCLAGYANEGGVGGCPKMSITISKGGYKTYIIEGATHSPEDTTVIYLEKE